MVDSKHLITTTWSIRSLPTLREMFVAREKYYIPRKQASVKHFSLLAAFFWQNIMWIDTWTVVRQRSVVINSQDLGSRRFLLYSLYSWGCPLIITVIANVMEELPDTYTVIRPKFRTDYCWFGSDQSMWVYFFGIISLVLIVNSVFFGLVIFHLCCEKTDVELRRSQDVHRGRMWACVKLFAVMGICWIAEIFSWQEGTCYVWLLPNIINSLQGFNIFLVFVCNRSIQKQLRDRGQELQSTIRSAVRTRLTRTTNHPPMRSNSIPMNQLHNNEGGHMSSPPPSPLSPK